MNRRVMFIALIVVATLLAPISGVANAATCTIKGTSGADNLKGTAKPDIICGLGGNDTIRGMGNNDRLVGGNGADKLYGDAGDDSIDGGPGKDQAFGGLDGDGCVAEIRDSTCEMLWSDRYVDAPDTDSYGRAIAYSPDGSRVFITGQSPRDYEEDNDIATLAFDAKTGKRLWVKRYDTEGHGNESGASIVVSADGDLVFVGGGVSSRPTVIAYRASDGRREWMSQPDVADIGSWGFLERLTLSADGHTLFGAGASENGALLQAIDADNGAPGWVRTLPAFGEMHDVVEAPDGLSVYASGRVDNGHTRLAFAEVEAADGDVVWSSEITGEPGRYQSGAYSLEIDPAGTYGYVIVDSDHSTLGRGWWTVQVDLSDGSKGWNVRNDGPDYHQDSPADVIVSADGTRVISTGVIDNGDVYQAQTIGYDATDGSVEWTDTVDTAEYGDKGLRLGVHPTEAKVYVVGASQHSYYGLDRTFLRTLDPTTGALLRHVNSGGAMSQYPLEPAVDPTGSSVAIIGNGSFSTWQDIVTVLFPA